MACLDGALTHLPCEWDFPDGAVKSISLRTVQVGTWAAWVFINLDQQAMPLEAYLDPIRKHFEPYLWERSYLGLRVAKQLRRN